MMLVLLLFFLGLSGGRGSRQSKQRSALDAAFADVESVEGPWELPTHHTADTKESGPPSGMRNPLRSLMTTVTGASAKNTTWVENRFKKRYPVLLEDEPVEFAWKNIRDYVILTDRRLLIVNVEGLGKSVTYKSYIYSKVVRFAVRTKGLADLTSELIFWMRRGKVQVSLAPATANLLAVNQYVSRKLLKERSKYIVPLAFQVDKAVEDSGDVGEVSITDVIKEKSNKAGAVTRLLGMVPKNARKIEAALKERKTDKGPILFYNEVVRAAYQGVRDFLVFTDRRIVLQDIQGVTGVSVAYHSFPYEQIVSFELSSVGVVDVNANFKISTEEMEFRGAISARANLYDLEKIIASCVLGGKAAAPEGEVVGGKAAAPEGEVVGGKAAAPEGDVQTNSSSASLLSISEEVMSAGPDLTAYVLGATTVDAANLTEKLKTGPTNILFQDETVVRGLRTVRDFLVITSDRILSIDIRGTTGKQIEYLTIVPENVVEFECVTPGVIDLDGEIMLRFVDDHTAKFSIRKSEDVLGIQKALARLVLKGQPEVKDDGKAVDSSVLGGLFGGFRGVERVSDDLHGGHSAVLFDDEKVHAVVEAWESYMVTEKVFEDENIKRVQKEAWRKALVVMTSRRLLTVSLEGVSGPLHHARYSSIPYHNIRFFKALALPGSRVGAPSQVGETHFMLCTGSFVHKFTFSFGASGDLLRFQNKLAWRVLRKHKIRASVITGLREDEKSKLSTQPVGWVSAGFGGFTPNRDELSEQLHHPPFDVLFEGEDVMVAYHLFAQDKRLKKTSKLLVLTQYRAIVITALNPHVSVSSVSHAAIDYFTMSPGFAGVTKRVMGINQTVWVVDASITVSTATKVGNLVDAKVRRGLDIVDLAVYIAAFSR